MSQTEQQETQGVAFGGDVNPIFPVSGLAASIDYYVNVLGFKVDWQDPGVIACVSRGRCALFLIQGDQGNPPTWVWIGISDAARLFEEYKSKGARIRHPPTNYYWAYEMQVEDLDGNVMRLGSDPKDDQPFGPWLDMHGRSWGKKEDGNWTNVEE
jgi:catechol 2,3-dioxygenase-like lactoylglutathione lyase family enzyme